jgi:superoxide dismutase
MTLANKSKLILNTLLVAASFTSMMHSAHAASPNAAPFGIEIGVASCDDVRAKFGSSNESKLGDGDVWLVAKNANALYAGATKIGARCSNNKVIAILVEASKGGWATTQAERSTRR